MWIIYKWWKVLLLCKHGRTIFYSEFNWRNEVAVIVLLYCRRSDAPLPIYKDKPYACINILFDVSIWRYSSENSNNRRSKLMPQAKEWYKNVLWIETNLENWTLTKIIWTNEHYYRIRFSCLSIWKSFTNILKYNKLNNRVKNIIFQCYS